MRQDYNNFNKEYEKTEDYLKALQSVGQIVGELLKKLSEEKCEKSIKPLKKNR